MLQVAHAPYPAWDTPQRRTLPHLLKRAVEDVEDTLTVDFNRVQLSREGIHNGKDIAPWDQVREVKIDENVITVEKKGNWLTWLTVGLSEVKNPHVFAALVESRGVPLKREG